MIDIFHLNKSYGEQSAVKDLTLSVASGELFSLLGPNGAGKSTTVRVLTGLTKPTGGIVRIAGFDVVEDPIEVRRRVGYVPENAALYESLTAGEYLGLVGDLRHMDARRVRQQTEELFEIFGLSMDDRRKLLSEYSKGMKQKVLIVSALIHNPDVLILDEPLSGLDANAALIFKELVRKFAVAGKTIFFCSHVLDVVERIADRIGVLHQGELIAIGTTAEILESTGQPSLERAFNVLTGGANVEWATEEFVRSIASN